jgi:DNA-binding MarR family transcriptional regulator
MTDSLSTPTPRWLSPEELTTWRTLLTVMQTVPATLDSQLRKDHGLTLFEYYIMAMLSDSPELTCPMSDLAMLTNGSLSRLSHAVEKLERRGWVTRSKHPEDGRTTLATLQPQGYEMLKTAAPSHVEEVRRVLFNVMDPAKVAALQDCLAPVAEKRCEG